MLNLGSTIRSLRKKERYSQSGLADELGVSQSIIAHWENQKRQVTLEQAQQIALFFGLSLSQLIKIAEENKSEMEIAA